MLARIHQTVLKAPVALILATAVFATVVAVAPATALAQDQAEEDSATVVAFVSGLLTADDLAHLFPLRPQYRRELLEFELSRIVEHQDVTLTEEQESAIIETWLSLLAPYQPQPDYTQPPNRNPDIAAPSREPRSSSSGSSSGGRPSTDTGYLPCSSSYIESIGISFNRVNGYDIIRLDPSRRAYGLLHASRTYTDMVICLRSMVRYWPHVRSWDSIYHQLPCHAAGWFLPTGQTWDLEGHRRSNRNWSWGVWSHQCNW